MSAHKELMMYQRQAHDQYLRSSKMVGLKYAVSKWVFRPKND